MAQETGPQGASSSHWLWGGQASSEERQLGVNNQPNIIILECFQPEEGPGSRGKFRGQRGKGVALSGGSVVVVVATAVRGVTVMRMVSDHTASALLYASPRCYLL